MSETKSKSFCSVPFCSTSKQKQPYLSFHDFPVDKGLRKKWTQAIRREEGSTFRVSRGSSFVCSLHFTKNDYLPSERRKRLKVGAVPSRFQWNSWGDGKRGRLSECERAGSRLRDDFRHVVSDVPLETQETDTEKVCEPEMLTDHDYARPPSPGEASMDSTSPDFVPSVFVYTNQTGRPGGKLKSGRYHRKRRKDIKRESMAPAADMGSVPPVGTEDLTPGKDQESTAMAAMKARSQGKGAAVATIQRLHEAKMVLIMPEEPLLAQPLRGKPHVTTTTQPPEPQQTHYTNRSFCCNTCGKSFVSWTHLRQHRRMHVGERPFTCKLCSCSFTTRYNLQRHLKVHKKDVHFCQRPGARAWVEPQQPSSQVGPRLAATRLLSPSRRQAARKAAVAKRCFMPEQVTQRLLIVREAAGPTLTKIAYDIDVVI